MLAAHCLARMMVYLSKRICSQRYAVCAANGFGLRICAMHAERIAHNTHDAGEQSTAFDSAHSASYAAMLPSFAFLLAHMRNARRAHRTQYARRWRAVTGICQRAHSASHAAMLSSFAFRLAHMYNASNPRTSPPYAQCHVLSAARRTYLIPAHISPQ